MSFLLMASSHVDWSVCETFGLWSVRVGVEEEKGLE